jgi:ubiquinone/menaquinone biosynthesis C-methylase UbiE
VPTVEELYGDFWAEDESGLEGELERSLDPRPVESLYDAFGELGVTDGDLVLDVGCRDAKHSVELVRRFGCRVVAADVIPQHLEKARDRVAEEGVDDRIMVLEAAIESLPLGDGSIDYVWCRDMLNHVELPRALAETARVLEPGGRMLVYQTFATERCEPDEAARIYRALAMPPENMSRSYFEQNAHEAGFEITGVDEIDSEWREHWIENGKRDVLDDLLRIARLRRREEDLVSRYGRDRYEAAFWGSAWGAYQLLGKLCPTVYALKKPDG